MRYDSEKYRRYFSTVLCDKASFVSVSNVSVILLGETTFPTLSNIKFRTRCKVSNFLKFLLCTISFTTTVSYSDCK